MATRTTSASSCEAIRYRELVGSRSVVTYSLLLSALSGLDVHIDTLAADVSADDLGVELKLHALLGEELLHRLGHVRIHARSTDGTQELNNGDLSSQARPYGTLANVSWVRGR